MKRRDLLTAMGLSGLTPFLLPKESHAIGFPVIDIASLVQAVVSAVNMIQSVINQVTQIKNQMDQIDLKNISLKMIEDSVFDDIRTISDIAESNFDELINRSYGIGFDLDTIRDQVQQTFGDIENWDNVRLDQYTNHFRQWNNQLMNSAMDTMRSQAVVNNLKSSSEEMSRILSDNTEAKGEVSQLQLVNRALGVLNSQFGGLAQSIISASRLTANHLAQTASSGQAKLEAKSRLMDNYLDMGPEPVNRLRRIPGMED